MSTTLAGLAGLVKGYTEETSRQAKEALDNRIASRDYLLKYLGHLAVDPNVPQEHQQWAMQKAAELTQADVTKKLPKVDLGELPAVMRKPPAQQEQTTIPGGLLKPPVGPGMAAVAPGTPGGPAGPPAPSGDVGRASNGTVNAVGDTNGVLPASLRPPVMIPPQGALVRGPEPAPEQISPAGQLHLLTPGEKQQQQMDVEQEAINRLQTQFPEKSREELAYFAQHGVFPKPEGFTLPPGSKRFDAQGREIAVNTTPKPGAKSGFEPVMGSNGPVGIKDVGTGGMLTPDQVAANPEAKAVWQQALDAHKRQMGEQVDKETRAFSRALDMADIRQAQALDRQVTGEAVKLADKAKGMVDVLDASEKYMRTGKFTPRQDLTLIVRAVRAMNPGTVRLPQRELELELKAGSYGDRFRRWYDTATTGILPPDQRTDLMNVIRDETTQTGTSAAQNWGQAFAGREGKLRKPVPTYLQRFMLQPPTQPTSGGAPPTPAGNLPPGWQ